MATGSATNLAPTPPPLQLLSPASPHHHSSAPTPRRPQAGGPAISWCRFISCCHGDRPAIIAVPASQSGQSQGAASGAQRTRPTRAAPGLRPAWAGPAAPPTPTLLPTSVTSARLLRHTGFERRDEPHRARTVTVLFCVASSVLACWGLFPALLSLTFVSSPPQC